MRKKLSKLCKYVALERPPIMIAVIGRMGSGKTHLARRIYEECFSDYCFVELRAEDLDELEKLSAERQCSKYFFFFDDFSYQLTGRSRADKERLNKFFRVRHIFGTSDIVIVIVAHYVRSIAPFLRTASVKILTSISEAEVKMYSSEYLFTEPTLWDYVHYYRKYSNKYIALISSRAGEHIVDLTERKRAAPRLQECRSADCSDLS